MTEKLPKDLQNLKFIQQLNLKSQKEATAKAASAKGTQNTLVSESKGAGSVPETDSSRLLHAEQWDFNDNQLLIAKTNL